MKWTNQVLLDSLSKTITIWSNKHVEKVCVTVEMCDVEIIVCERTDKTHRIRQLLTGLRLRRTLNLDLDGLFWGAKEADSARYKIALCHTAPSFVFIYRPPGPTDRPLTHLLQYLTELAKTLHVAHRLWAGCKIGPYEFYFIKTLQFLHFTCIMCWLSDKKGNSLQMHRELKLDA